LQAFPVDGPGFGFRFMNDHGLNLPGTRGRGKLNPRHDRLDLTAN
jgi:hypothetical protein